MAYNTTPFHGKACRVEKNNVAVEFTTGWTLDVTGDMGDISAQGDDWTEAIPGQYSWSGTFTASLVLGNTEQKAFVDNIITATPGVKLTDVIFLLDISTNGFTGNIYITGFSMNPTVGDAAMATFTFQGDGALSVSASV